MFSFGLHLIALAGGADYSSFIRAVVTSSVQDNIKFLTAKKFDINYSMVKLFYPR
jgi:hypothetical protein